MKPVNAASVAVAVIDYLTKGDDNIDMKSINTMQLQKLVFYCQAYSLAWTGLPMFEEEVQAWNHGPVIPDLWRLHQRKISVDREDVISAVADRGSQVIALESDQQIIVETVCEALGGLTGWQLRNRTHSEKPWIENFDAEAPRHDEVITHEEMKFFYLDH